jgi:Tfp pilus assembly protein PilX
MKRNNKKGFALLFSVLIASLLLTIGLSIFSITLKELAISTSARQSIYAFYAADSGREYALHEDVKLGNVDFDTQSGNSSEDFLGQSVVSSDSNGPYYDVTITKTWGDVGETMISTTIVSRGYDSVFDDRVERAIQQTY